MNMKIHTFSRFLLLTVAMAAVSGCSSIEPWVKPYERDRLADPIMEIVHLDLLSHLTVYYGSAIQIGGLTKLDGTIQVL